MNLGNVAKGVENHIFKDVSSRHREFGRMDSEEETHLGRVDSA